MLAFWFLVLAARADDGLEAVAPGLFVPLVLLALGLVAVPMFVAAAMSGDTGPAPQDPEPEPPRPSPPAREYDSWVARRPW